MKKMEAEITALMTEKGDLNNALATAKACEVNSSK